MVCPPDCMNCFALFLSSLFFVVLGGGAVSSITIMLGLGVEFSSLFSSSSDDSDFGSSLGAMSFSSRTAFKANSVRSNSTNAQTFAVISGCLFANGLISAGIGFPGRKIRTRTISPQTEKIPPTASIVGRSNGRWRATTVRLGVVSSYSGNASNLLTLVLTSFTSKRTDFLSIASAT